MLHFEPLYYGIPADTPLKLSELFQGGLMISQDQLIVLVRDKVDQENYTMEEGSYLRLKRALQFVTGMRTHFEGIPITFPMTVPTQTVTPSR